MPVVSGQDNHQIITVCDKNETYRTEPTEKYKTLCKNLLKNLKILSNNNHRNQDNFFTGCKNLNNWLYFEENELSVSSDIINQIFQEYKKIKEVNNHLPDCPYSAFDKGFNEKEKLINLRIFNDNSETIQGLLKNNNMSDDCSLKRYLYQCIQIYRDMNSKYCSSGSDTRDENKNSCDIISQFNNLYRSYIYKNKEITHNFPELSSHTPSNVIDGCSLKESKSDSYSDEAQLGTPITNGVSTALGAMAGISSLLALSYKVCITFIQIYEQYLKYMIIFHCSIK
ncbi:hypothetical protein PVBG_04785 [Plasmodium vivax Brazil I]|uniref:Uncharacterized protein n=1 Tax=Plasmodium vivax (strain Brazil I) TaxID=1033975 RepID=A0A0J9T0L9_PLAV1|nr:hypothetical protein PVBG_04785 [Plasmodium vivax Brazil I]